MEIYHHAWLIDGACAICGSNVPRINRSGGESYAHWNCWASISEDQRIDASESCKEYELHYKDKPQKTPEELRAELLQIAKEVLDGCGKDIP